MAKETINLGVIGVGGIGRVHAYNVAFKVKNAQLMAIADVNRDAALNFVKEYKLNNVVIYDDYRKLLENGNIDGVVIATP
ncbi:MAG: Gfo/Idh/MocA family oxidoreductase, partial [Acidianus sp.]|uniref:Gfo/Idh/MocA family oxidoreductase n=1 Tax=Acidianus sp. TaxID=1872104 RepID=UPI00397CFA60